MSELEIVQIPMLRDNYGYLLIDHATGTTAVVDPSESGPVLDVLSSRDLPLHFILNTHHHPDHVGGNIALKEKAGCKVICSQSDKSRIPGATDGVEEGDIITIGKAEATVIEVPGHTVGHVAFYFKREQALFSGDTLFSLGCGKLFEGSPDQMWISLRRLADLPRATKVYCGHEYTEENGRFALSVDPTNTALKDYCHHVADLRAQNLPTVPSTIAIEVETNPFLRAPNLAEKIGLPSHTLPHEAFAKMRELKNKF